MALRRAEAGRKPDDRQLTDLIGEVTTRTQRFSALWATHDVRSATIGDTPGSGPARWQDPGVRVLIALAGYHAG